MGSAGSLCRAAGVAPDKQAARGCDPSNDDSERSDDTHPTVLLAALRAAESHEIALDGGASCPPLAAFPTQLLCVAGLRLLALRKSLFTSLPPEFGAHLPSLEELDLSDGHLNALPRSVADLARLRRLTLSKNHLVTLPEIVWPAALVELNLFDNRLVLLPSGLAALEHLEDLNVASNQLTQLPRACTAAEAAALDATVRLSQQQQLGALSGVEVHAEAAAGDPLVVEYRWRRLKRLAVQMNKLTSLPDLSCAAATLVSLQLNFNMLTRLPVVGPARVLVMIDASHNRIRELPPAVALAQLPALASLSLKHNALEGELDAGIGGCRALEVLNLEGNPRLQWLPEALGACAQLRVLLLKDCGLVALPFELALQAPRLSRVSVERTPLALAMGALGLGSSRSAMHATAAKAAASRLPTTLADAASGQQQLLHDAEPPPAPPLSPRSVAQQVTLVRHLSSKCEAAGGWLKM